MPRVTKSPTTRFLALVTHDGEPQVCWAEFVRSEHDSTRATALTAKYIRAFVTLTPQEKQRGGWVFFRKWEAVTPRTVDRVRQAHLGKEQP